MIKGVLLDLGGVVYVGDSPLPGAIAAIGRLRAAGLPVRYITNTTRSSRRALAARLARLGLTVEPQDIFVPAVAARAMLHQAGLSPHLLVHPGLVEDFGGSAPDGPPAVVIGDAADAFTYQALNRAFRLLVAGAPLYALAANRYFRDRDGALSLDAGPFVKALEFAAGCTATVVGKPAPAFFAAAVEALGCRNGEAVMIGDDAADDVGGALAAGLQAILVRTGKYTEGAERHLSQRPSLVADDLDAAVNWILSQAGSAAPAAR